MEVRDSCRVAGTPGAAGTDPVISACPTANLRQGRLLDGFQPPGTHLVERSADAATQVSSLGMPLVNELFIGLDDKNRSNSSRPRNNSTFANYVTNPVLQAVLMAVESSLSFYWVVASAGAEEPDGIASKTDGVTAKGTILNVR